MNTTEETRRSPTGILPGLILILVGVLLLAGNLISIAPWIYPLGLGLAFLAAYFWTKRYGLLIAGSLISSLSLFTAVEDRVTTDGLKAALLFTTLGLAFLAIYVFKGVWQRWWPLAPAGVLMASSATIALVSSVSLPDVQEWNKLAQWWPLFLILFGAWLLAGRRLSPTARLITGLSLGLLVTLFLVSSVVIGTASNVRLGRGDWSWLGIGRAEARETMERVASLPAGGKLVVVNSSGNTTIHRGETSDVKVMATKRAWSSSEEQARTNLSDILVNVEESDGTVEIGWANANFGKHFDFSYGARVDYDITIPVSISVDARSSSGKVLVREVDGDVKVRSSSGTVELSQIGGTVSAVVSSGETRVQNIDGQVDVQASSGRIVAQDIRDTFRLETRSGSIDLAGAIRKGGEIKTSSGSVRLAPGLESAFFLDAATRSGSINVDPRHKLGKSEKDAKTATVGAGGPTVNVRVTSGSITLR